MRRAQRSADASTMSITAALDHRISLRRWGRRSRFLGDPDTGAVPPPMRCRAGSHGYGRAVRNVRSCSKPSCRGAAVATLTYVYADSTAVLGPLATYAEPHCYDLCEHHSKRMTAPLGWEIVRLTPDPEALRPSSDDLEALADAVREAAGPRAPSPPPTPMVEVGRRGHLRILRNVEE